jgi:hypothetical protein
LQKYIYICNRKAVMLIAINFLNSINSIAVMENSIKMTDSKELISFIAQLEIGIWREVEFHPYGIDAHEENFIDFDIRLSGDGYVEMQHVDKSDDYYSHRYELKIHQDDLISDVVASFYECDMKNLPENIRFNWLYDSREYKYSEDHKYEFIDRL